MHALSIHLFSSAFLAIRDVYSYDQHKDKYAKPQKRKGFNEGLWEVENDRYVNFHQDVITLGEIIEEYIYIYIII